MSTPDVTTLVTGLDFSSISTAVLAVATQHVGMLVTLAGCYFVLGFLKINSELKEERKNSPRVDRDGNYVAPLKKDQMSDLVSDDGSLDDVMALDAESERDLGIEKHGMSDGLAEDHFDEFGDDEF
jgi:hypothetical protein